MIEKYIDDDDEVKLAKKRAAERFELERIAKDWRYSSPIEMVKELYKSILTEKLNDSKKKTYSLDRKLEIVVQILAKSNMEKNLKDFCRENFEIYPPMYYAWKKKLPAELRDKYPNLVNEKFIMAGGNMKILDDWPDMKIVIDSEVIGLKKNSGSKP